MKFDFHFNEIVKKLSSQLYILSTMRQNVTRALLITYFKTHMEPIISFGILIFGSTSHKELCPLFNVQKEKLRKNCFMKKTDNVIFFFATYIVLTVYEVYVRQVLDFVSKSVIGFLSTGRLITLS